MNRRKPERVDQPKRRPLALNWFGVIWLALGLALSLCAACSGGSSPSPTSPVSSTTAATGSPTLSTAPTSTPPSPAPTTTAAKPVAHCPKLKAETTPQVPLECTSAAVIGSAAARVGQKRQGDDPTILGFVYVLSYYRSVLNPIQYRREVNIFHYKNGAVASLLCSGVVTKTLDPALGVCLDVGPTTRTDRPAVHAWALRAEATITRSTSAQPSLTAGKLTYVACSDPNFPKTSDHTVAFEMNVYIQHSGASTARQDCSR